MRKYLILLLSLIMCVATLSGCNNSNTTPISTVGTTAASSVTGGPNAPPLTGTHDIPNPELKERTSWNIEMTFVKYEDGIITVAICDRDNQGFYFNDLYFELEIFKDGAWTKLTKLNEASAYQNYGYLFPSEKDDYVDMWSFNRTIALKDGVTLETGHYRLTKILSGRKISFEFDMVID